MVRNTFIDLWNKCPLHLLVTWNCEPSYKIKSLTSCLHMLHGESSVSTAKQFQSFISVCRALKLACVQLLCCSVVTHILAQLRNQYNIIFWILLVCQYKNWHVNGTRWRGCTDTRNIRIHTLGNISIHSKFNRSGANGFPNDLSCFRALRGYSGVNKIIKRRFFFHRI